MSQEKGLTSSRIGTVNVGFKHGVHAKELHAALDRILDLTGCLACGLVGIDGLIFRGIDPVAFEVSEKMNSLRSEIPNAGFIDAKLRS